MFTRNQTAKIGRSALLCLVTAALLALAFSKASARPEPSRITLPIEVLGEAGTTGAADLTLTAAQAQSAQTLWLHIHGLRYAEEASIQINSAEWLPLRNDTISVAEPGKSFGGIGGGFSAIKISIALPKNSLAEGSNTIRFRFN